MRLLRGHAFQKVNRRHRLRLPCVLPMQLVLEVEIVRERIGSERVSFSQSMLTCEVKCCQAHSKIRSMAGMSSQGYMLNLMKEGEQAE